MLDDPEKKTSVGSPTEYADAEEVPTWFSELFTWLFSFPILVGCCGLIPLLLSAMCCILELFFYLL